MNCPQERPGRPWRSSEKKVPDSLRRYFVAGVRLARRPGLRLDTSVGSRDANEPSACLYDAPEASVSA